MDIHKGFILLLLSVWLGGGSAWGQTGVIAHRGYWTAEGSAQNSLTALEKAQELGVYGSEFDILLTADGVPVVNHDDSIQGICIETAAYADLQALKLKNGETLPTLEAYLEAGKKDPDTRLILEIKPHRRVVNEDRAVQAVLYLVDRHGVADQVEYISFSMNICKELIRRAPGAQVSYLRGEVCPADLKVLGFTGLDYHESVFARHPDWIHQARELGLTVNVWTVNDPARMSALMEAGVDFITTDKPAELKQLTEAVGE